MFHVVWHLSCGSFTISSHAAIWERRLMSVAMLWEAPCGTSESEKQHGDFLNDSVGEVKIWGSLWAAGKTQTSQSLFEIVWHECIRAQLPIIMVGKSVNFVTSQDYYLNNLWLVQVSHSVMSLALLFFAWSEITVASTNQALLVMFYLFVLKWNTPSICVH